MGEPQFNCPNNSYDIVIWAMDGSMGGYLWRWIESRNKSSIEDVDCVWQVWAVSCQLEEEMGD